MADESDNTEPDLLRDGLLMQAERGEITAKQAEEVAATHGLEPFERKPDLPRFDPKLKSHWSMVMAVAWIAWRDFDLVREQDPEFRSACFHWIYRKWKDSSDKIAEPVERAGYFLETRPAPTVRRLALLEVIRAQGNVPSTAMTVRKAEAELWKALSEGRLISEGINIHGTVVEIPSREWPHLRLFDDGGRETLRYVHENTEPFTAITFRRSDLFRIWPEPAVTAKAAAGCQEWLIGQMQASPDASPKSKAEYFQDAKQRFAISRNVFNRAWGKAIEKTGANTWSAAGRPKKKSNH